jgi:hypothetical protein
MGASVASLAAESETGERKGRRPNGRRRAVSTLLAEFGKKGESERIRLGDVVRALAHRGHGLLLLLFALPNLVPLYLPGLAAIFSLPLAIVSTQMLLGRRQPWLPAAVLDRSLARADYERLVGRSAPWLARLERVLRPRLVGLTDPIGQRLVGLLCLALSLLLALPVPFTNIPLALPIALMGLALIARDGLLVMIGSALGAAAAGATLVFGWKALAAGWAFLAGLAG